MIAKERGTDQMTGREYYDAIVASVRGRGNYFKATQPDGYSFMGKPYLPIAKVRATGREMFPLEILP